jgi:hypothetical protein
VVIYGSNGQIGQDTCWKLAQAEFFRNGNNGSQYGNGYGNGNGPIRAY